MSHPSHQPLLQVVIDLVSFLALSDDETVNQDAAIQQLEDVAATLKRLPLAERDQFLAFIAESAQRAAQSEDHKRSEFLNSLPEQLGLRD
jgi:hypothetical protein